MLHDILGHDHIQRHPPLIRNFTKSWHCYRNRPYYRFWLYRVPGYFHRTFGTGAVSKQKTLTPPDIWSCPIWDLHISNIEIILSWTCLYFQTSAKATSFFIWLRFGHLELLDDSSLPGFNTRNAHMSNIVNSNRF